MAVEEITQSTAGVGAEARSRHWNAVIAEAYFPLHLTFRDAAGFRGWLSRRPMGGLSLSRLVTDPLRYERRPGHIAGGREEEYLVTLPTLAPVEFRQMGRDVRCDPGAFILERGDEPYRFSYADRNDLLVLKVAKPRLAERLRDPDRFCARAFHAREGTGRLFAQMAAQAMAARGLDRRAGETVGRHIVELLALALDGAGDVPAGAGTAVRAAHLARAKVHVRRRLQDPDLSPEAVAAACGISKRYLHELFTDENRTVSQFVREERLAACRDLLAQPGRLPIAEIAYRHGFSDQAQFSRLFRARFGEAPSAFRARAARGGDET